MIKVWFILIEEIVYESSKCSYFLWIMKKNYFRNGDKEWKLLVFNFVIVYVFYSFYFFFLVFIYIYFINKNWKENWV